MNNSVTKRRLGRSGPEITTVGFGSWAAGGPWFAGWGPQSDDDSIAAIRRALDLGINWIDTAAVYGAGHSEEVVGRALEGRPRDGLFLFTKCGRISEAGERPRGDLRPESIRREIDASLRRLRTDVIDLYQIHWPDTETGTPIEESWAEMDRLKAEGKTRWIGASNFDVALLDRCQAIAPVDSLQPPFSLLRREAEADLLPWCEANGAGVLCYSPMQAGLLTGSFDINRVAEDDWRRRNPMFQEPDLSRNLEFVERLRPIAVRHGATVGQLAVAWVLTRPGVTAAIVGARRPDQVEQNAGAMGLSLTRDDLNAIEEAWKAR